MTQRPQISPEQQRQIHATACGVVFAAVNRVPERPTEAIPPAIGDLRVMGAFVTLKRGSRLRACCGVLGAPMPLGPTVRQAAWRTATEDSRFPTISPTELPFLHADVSLLYGFEVLARDRATRLASVEVGRHGLQIQRGVSAGLLLPSVATEHGYQPDEFLRQVCLKAGLPATAWEDEQAVLQTFETLSIAGDMAGESDSGQAEPKGPVTQESLRALTANCAANLRALLHGATPNYYAPNCPDGEVNSITLSLSSMGADAAHFFRISIRPGLPLQSTLFQLTEAAANLLRSGPGKSAQGQVQLAVSLLHDPAMHGTASDHDLRGLDPTTRAVFVFEGGRSAWCFDPAKTGEQLLQAAIETSGLQNARSAHVFSFAVHCTEPRMTVSNVPRPALGPAVRPTAVAGAFYPRREDELHQLLDRLIPAPDHPPQTWPAVLVPHAGLVYSGAVAARAFQRVTFPKSAIIFCPKHTRLGVDWAVAPHEQWSLPGATIRGDVELARKLVESIPGFELDAEAHRQEHAIEVLLPLLARFAPTTQIVAVAIGGNADFERCRQFASGLAALLRQRSKPPLLIISSDMNHYAPDAENRRLDEIALAALERLDPQAAYQTVDNLGISMCGMRPAILVMETLRQLGGLKRCERVAYSTSAEVAGDATRVVGYAGLLFA